jgi:hypothetical protein
MKLNRNGAANLVIITFILAALTVASLVFAFWAYSGRQKYKDDDNTLISSAVASAKSAQQSVDNKAFAVEEQNPLTEYVGPQAYGTISVYYPKNWSSYIDTSGSNNNPLDGYFFPGALPSVDDDGSVNFALRVQVESDTYSQVLQNYQSSSGSSSPVTIAAYSLPKLPNVVGVEVTGQLTSGINGTMVILPLRSNALEIWTEGTQYLTQFNNEILPNVSFSP